MRDFVLGHFDFVENVVGSLWGAFFDGHWDSNVFD